MSGAHARSAFAVLVIGAALLPLAGGGSAHAGDRSVIDAVNGVMSGSVPAATNFAHEGVPAVGHLAQDGIPGVRELKVTKSVTTLVPGNG